MSDGEEGLRLRFVGRRFEGARLPVGILPDIEAFRDLIVAFAKSSWLDSNKDRQRVPKGFDAQLNLDLVVIEDGSAVPVLKPSRHSAQDILPGLSSGLLMGAYEAMSAVLDEAANDHTYRPVLTRDQISALNRFGAGLRDDERVELLGTQGKTGQVISFDSFRRKSLITRLRETYEKRYEGDGYLSAVFADGKVLVTIPQYGDVTLDVGDRALDEFDGHLLVDVSLDITLELDAHDRVRGVKDLHSVDMQETPSPVANDAVARALKRLEEIKCFEAGWLDGEGEAITSVAISEAAQILKDGAEWFASAGIFPTLSGGIQIEVEKELVDLTITIEANGFVSGFLMLNAEDSDDVVDLDNAEDIMDAIRRYAANEKESVFAG